MDARVEEIGEHLFLVEFNEDVLTIVPLRDVDEMGWSELESSSKGIFESIRREHGTKVLVDMGKLRQCTSALLALMVRVWKSVSPQGGVLAFCNVNADVSEVLKQTRLDSLWSVYPTREAAYSALRGGS